MDFAVFPEIKAQLKGRRFTSLEELTYSTHGIIRQFDSAWYQKVFSKWWSDTGSVLSVEASTLKSADLQRK